MYRSTFSDTSQLLAEEIGIYNNLNDAAQACRNHAMRHVSFVGILAEEYCDQNGYDMAVQIAQSVRLYAVDPCANTIEENCYEN